MYGVLRVTPDAPASDASPACSVTLDPDAGAWVSMLEDHISARGALSAEARTFRDQMGIATDGPVVMSGHQAMLWHPGILAKLIAANTLSDYAGATVAWLIVDQDVNNPFALNFPERDARGRLRIATWELSVGNNQGQVPDMPAFARPTTLPLRLMLVGGTDDLTARLATFPDAVRARSNAPNGAVQITEALFDVLEPVTARPNAVYASRVAHTDLFARVIERMRDDPASAHMTYNDAAARFPDAGVRPLRTDTDRGFELPAWLMGDGGVRAPLFERNLSERSPGVIVPRGMLTTGLMRYAGCDLFVHGTGGRAYEPINDAWMGAWLGPWMDTGRLAPFVTASADVPLIFDGDPAVTSDNAARARWRAHHAGHHPGALGDAGAQEDRDALVRAIESAPYGSPERSALFGRLHELLRGARAARAAELDTLRAEADDVGARVARWTPGQDRAWSVVLHDPEALGALREMIEARFA